MDCEQALHRVFEYLDGEMTMWKREAIRRHLDECPPCADGFHFELHVRRVIVTKCHEVPPPDLEVRVARALGLPEA